jgi:asparagine synthase (glutamine-hydrolysing)
MCGIVGLVCADSELNRLGRCLEDAVTCLLHRGPDGHGSKSYRLDNGVAVSFGHTRLAILDLSDAGLQPFHSRDQEHSLTYNGEIYNYREIRSELEALGVTFRTSSDTEVLLEALIAWGTKALDKLEGMFAFGFLDKKAKKLLLVRDPFGIKPLHYAKVQDRLGFSSDIRSLRALFPELAKVNRKVAADFLLFGYNEQSAQTFVSGIASLLPGHLLEFDLSVESAQLAPVRYWNPDFSKKQDITFNEASSVFKNLLLESVSLHMRSDVPVGAALSGGLDSSSIVSIIRHLNPKAEIHTFSYLAADPRIDEERWVDMVTSWAGTKSHKVRLDVNVLFERDFDNLIRAQGEPFSTLSIYAQYKVFELAKSEGITVTLDGQGADELLAGYQGFAESRLLGLVEKGDLVNAARLIRGWTGWPGRSLWTLLSVGFAEFFPKIRRSTKFVGLAQAAGLIGNHSLELFSEEAHALAHDAMYSEPRHIRYRGRRLVETLLRELGPKRLTSLLRFADRNSMHHSIESRVPFLNRKLTEFTLSLPEEFLLSPEGETKHILRKSLLGIVPDEILNRRDKIGFEASTKGWGLGSSVLTEIANNLESVPLINAKESRAAIVDVVEGKRDLDSNLWRVINHARWVQLENISS